MSRLARTKTEISTMVANRLSMSPPSSATAMTPFPFGCFCDVVTQVGGTDDDADNKVAVVAAVASCAMAAGLQKTALRSTRPSLRKLVCTWSNLSPRARHLRKASGLPSRCSPFWTKYSASFCSIWSSPSSMSVMAVLCSGCFFLYRPCLSCVLRRAAVSSSNIPFSASTSSSLASSSCTDWSASPSPSLSLSLSLSLSSSSSSSSSPAMRLTCLMSESAARAS